MKCNRMVANVYRKHLSKFNVTDSQLSVIFVLSKAKSINQKGIAEILVLEKSTINRNIRRLLNDGIIKKGKDMNLSLTSKGQILLKKALVGWGKFMTEINSSLGEDGIMALDLVTSKLTP
ncbi:MAG: MarR family transcriptional regulator [Cellulophaga sp.]